MASAAVSPWRADVFTDISFLSVQHCLRPVDDELAQTHKRSHSRLERRSQPRCFQQLSRPESLNTSCPRSVGKQDWGADDFRHNIGNLGCRPGAGTSSGSKSGPSSAGEIGEQADYPESADKLSGAHPLPAKEDGGGFVAACDPESSFRPLHKICSGDDGLWVKKRQDRRARFHCVQKCCASNGDDDSKWDDCSPMTGEGVDSEGGESLPDVIGAVGHHCRRCRR